jgi:ribosome-associated protein
MSETPTIRLGQYLKLAGLVGTGGEAKYLIQEGLVRVNGEVETRRKRQLHPGDTIQFQDRTLTVSTADASRQPRPGKDAG